MNGFTGFYFSFVTLSTVGYGDITPVSRIALACGDGSDDGPALCRSPDLTPGRPLFQSKVRMIPGAVS
jgi:Ion channel